MLPTVRWKLNRGKWIPCIFYEGIWRTEGIVPRLFNVVSTVHWAEESLCSGLTRGMLLAGGTSSNLSFAMNLFNRDFHLDGGLEWLVSHRGHLTLGARASGGWVFLVDGLDTLDNTCFCPCHESNHNINIYDYIPNGLNDLCFNFQCYILACSCQETEEAAAYKG